MSLLRRAELCLRNQTAFKTLNAFISTPGGSRDVPGEQERDVIQAVRQSQIRHDNSELILFAARRHC